MRIRSIKPEFWESESLGRVSREARLLFIGLFSCCDDVGRARASSRLLASRLFPYDDDAFKRLPGWMAELEKQGCIRIYVVDGESYLDLPKWANHQKIDKPSASKLPSFDDVREDSREFENNSLGTGNGNREEEQEEDSADKPPSVRFQHPTVNPDLEAFRLRIGAIVRRRHDTPWNTKEMKALKEVFKLNTPEEDIQLVEARYKTNDPYLRRELYTLLNNWNGEVDKVRSGLLPGIGESRVAATSTNIEDYQ
jgi:hypothetical protein